MGPILAFISESQRTNLLAKPPPSSQPQLANSLAPSEKKLTHVKSGNANDDNHFFEDAHDTHKMFPLLCDLVPVLEAFASLPEESVLPNILLCILR